MVYGSCGVNKNVGIDKRGNYSINLIANSGAAYIGAPVFMDGSDVGMSNNWHTH